MNAKMKMIAMVIGPPSSQPGAAMARHLTPYSKPSKNVPVVAMPKSGIKSAHHRNRFTRNW